MMRSFSISRWGWVIIHLLSLPLADTTSARHLVQAPPVCPISIQGETHVWKQWAQDGGVNSDSFHYHSTSRSGVSVNDAQVTLFTASWTSFLSDKKSVASAAVGAGDTDASGSGTTNAIRSALEKNSEKNNELERARLQSFFDRNNPERQKNIHSNKKVPLALMGSAVAVFVLLCWLALWILKKRYS
ncbi:MAG: hypothetical protein LR011_06840 [Verrucomicrobia bacterium]|nr:hypothetical protein [Verrucomicrobiota bacterium]